MKKQQAILLCDLDAFYASVEQRDNPDLKDKPVIIGGSPEGRGVVSTCSYEARRFGVRSAMPMKKALQLCPHATVLQGRMRTYKQVSGQVLALFKRFTPDLEVVSIDEAYLALPYEKGLVIAEKIHRLVRDELMLPISIGISTNKLLAKIACELAKPDRIATLWPDEIEDKLWPLPVRALPGIGPVAEKELVKLGIRTVQDLASFPREQLQQQIGSSAVTLHGYAHGIDKRNLEGEQEVKSISEETTFSEDLKNTDKIKAVLSELAAGVGYRLRCKGLQGRTITLKLRFSNFKTITRAITLVEPTDSDSDIYQTACTLFGRHCSAPPWRLVGIQVSNFEQEEQLSLLRPDETALKTNRLTRTRDQLHQKYDTDIIIQGRRLELNDEE